MPAGSYRLPMPARSPRRRVAAAALARAVEIGGSRFGIAGEHVLDLERRAQRVVDLLVNEVRKVLDLGVA